MASALDELGGLDPDDPRQASQQIASRLRAAILDRRLGPGEKLPSQPELATRYGVARETVKRALDSLKAEKLIVSRQGSGVYVRTQMARPVELRPHIEAAFSREVVAIDFAGLSAETLRDALSETLDKVRAGDLSPATLTIRILVADTDQPMVVPAISETGADDPRLRTRLGRIVRRATDAIADQVTELAELGIISEASVAIRSVASTPFTKLYLINGEECFFGFYPVTVRPLTLQGETIEMFDTLGKDVPLLHFSATADDGDSGSQFVLAARQWFDSVWTSVAVPVSA